MDTWQAKRQLAWLLAQARWADAPTDVVLVDAVVSEDEAGNFLPGDFLADGPAAEDLPFATVARMSSLQDPESFNRLEVLMLRAFVVVGGAGVAGSTGVTATDEYDTHGENQVEGELRGADGAGGSTGRDVDEVVDRLVESALGQGQLVDSTHGFQGEVVGDLEAIAADGVQVLVRPVDVHVYNATRSRYYHPARKLALASPVAGVVNVSWTAPPARFDSKSYVVRRGTNPGDAAPSSPAGGTDVPLNGAATAQATGLVTGQTYNFSVFAAYDEIGAGVAQRWSDPISKAVVVT